MTADPVFTDEQLLFTIVQVARALAVSRTTVYELINAGELHTIHVGRCCRISRAEIYRYLSRLDQAPPDPPPPNEPKPPHQRRRAAPDSQHALFPVGTGYPTGQRAQ